MPEGTKAGEGIYWTLPLDQPMYRGKLTRGKQRLGTEGTGIWGKGETGG